MPMSSSATARISSARCSGMQTRRPTTGRGAERAAILWDWMHGVSTEEIERYFCAESLSRQGELRRHPADCRRHALPPKVSATDHRCPRHGQRRDLKVDRHHASTAWKWTCLENRSACLKCARRSTAGNTWPCIKRGCTRKKPCMCWQRNRSRHSWASAATRPSKGRDRLLRR